jgi:hypothetical protein
LALAINQEQPIPVGRAGIIGIKPPHGSYNLLRRREFKRIVEQDGVVAEKSNKHEASAQFAKLQRANDAKKAMSEYESSALALRAKTERLKALRLARDGATPPQAKAAPKRKAGKKSEGNLSDWLDGQAKEGRRS